MIINPTLTQDQLKSNTQKAPRSDVMNTLIHSDENIDESCVFI